MRISSESFCADTDGPVLDDATLSVWCANTRTLEARIDATLFDASLSCLTIRIDFTFWFDDSFDSYWSRLATDERIAREAISARADRVMADHLTLGVDSTSSRTRIFTFLCDTSHVVGTIRVGNALGFASHVRITQ